MARLVLLPDRQGDVNVLEIWIFPALLLEVSDTEIGVLREDRCSSSWKLISKGLLDAVHIFERWA